MVAVSRIASGRWAAATNARASWSSTFVLRAKQVTIFSVEVADTFSAKLESVELRIERVKLLPNRLMIKYSTQTRASQITRETLLGLHTLSFVLARLAKNLRQEISPCIGLCVLFIA